MEYKYSNLTTPDDFVEGPSDDELKRIEEELENYSDWLQFLILWFLLEILVVILLIFGYKIFFCSNVD